MRAGLSALLSHWRRHPIQLLTLIIGLATATALWSGVQAINAEARASYAAASATLGDNARPYLTSGGPIPHATYIALRRAGHQVTPLTEGTLDTEAGPLRILGLDPFTQAPGETFLDGLEPGDTSFLAPPGQLLVAPQTVRALEGSALPPRMAVEGVAPDQAVADIAIAQGLLNRPGEIDRLIITGPASLTAPPISDIAPGLRLTDPSDEVDTARLTDSFHLNLTAFGLLSFAVGLFIVRGAIGLAFEQRRPVFRTLRALGLSRSVLIGLLSVELLILALLAGAIGVALGWLIAALLLPDVAATLRGLYGAEVGGSLTLKPVWWVSGLGIAVLGTGIAALASLWQTARMPLLAPARPRAWALASERAMLGQALAALACGAVALVAWALGGSLLAGFVMLGGMLLGAALALPLILHRVLGLLSHTSRGPRSEWFWGDARQQLPGLTLALMALLLALSANIGVGTMVSSFRLTFIGWLDQRLAAELYIRAETDTQAREIEAMISDRVDAILPIRSAPTTLGGQPGEVYGVADHATYRDHWPLIARSPGVWDTVAAGAAVLINEQLARRADLWPGDQVKIGDWDAPIGGVYSDYGNPQPQAMIGLNRFAQMFPEAPDLRFGVRMPPEGIAALRREILDRFVLPADQISDQRAIKDLSLGIFERTFTVTAALNVLTLGVAGLAILTSLLTISTMRQPQIAPVWALGMTRRQLAALDLARAALLALLTFGLALPVGLALSWVLLAVINVEAFGWRLPLHLFPRDWLALGALAVVAALIAALLPALRLSRIPPSELLKVFANER
ncbi:FtsX-like permease family protein [Palleronia caenipelagi]|uniref:FtsX-like permease family protein n=1 Tax=Palleronia caenipelagi TaxID=2489174 RepID=A0A547QAG1_9RHOB|nr:FtsX-like permease family protein [Palleronia caenipelagi]TRD23349.1 FtsX-like permease family protein [Palleronia caenipelagi]